MIGKVLWAASVVAVLLAPAFAQTESAPTQKTAFECGAHAIARTHRVPPYPDGVVSAPVDVQMTVIIDAAGLPSAVTIDHSSGYPLLDDAAVEEVKGEWRWTPLTGCSSAWLGVRVMFQPHPLR